MGRLQADQPARHPGSLDMRLCGLTEARVLATCHELCIYLGPARGGFLYACLASNRQAHRQDVPQSLPGSTRKSPFGPRQLFQLQASHFWGGLDRVCWVQGFGVQRVAFMLCVGATNNGMLVRIGYRL